MRVRMNGVALRQRGLTLIELMVAMVLSVLVVTMAGLALMASNTSLRSTDANAQLNDMAMTVASVLRRSIVQAGYQPSSDSRFTREVYNARFGAKPYPDVYGRSAAQMGVATAGVSQPNVNALYSGGGGGGLAVSANPDGNDLLVIRLQALPEKLDTGAGYVALTDLCTGNLMQTDPESVYSVTDKAEMHKPVYAFFVVPDADTGGILYCKSWVGANASGTRDAVSVPLADGVLSFKVLYGIYNSSSGTPGNLKGSPNEWKAASAMSANDWYNVKRIRIGLVLQSKPGAAMANSESATLYPLGPEFAVAGNVGSQRTVSYSDGRLYRTMNFNVVIGNRLTPRL